MICSNLGRVSSSFYKGGPGGELAGLGAIDGARGDVLDGLKGERGRVGELGVWFVFCR